MPIERDTQTQRTDLLEHLGAEDLEEFRSDTRRYAVWNRRASLLRAVDREADVATKTALKREISDIENAYVSDAWERYGDAQARIDPITPIPPLSQIKALADANRAAAQRVALANQAQELVQLGTTFLQIANGKLPGPGLSADVESDVQASAEQAIAPASIGTAAFFFAAGTAIGFALAILLRPEGAPRP